MRTRATRLLLPAKPSTSATVAVELDRESHRNLRNRWRQAARRSLIACVVSSTLFGGFASIPAVADDNPPSWPVEVPFVPGGCSQPANFLQARDQYLRCLFTSDFAAFLGINLLDSVASRVEMRRQGDECVSDIASRAMCVSRVATEAMVSLYGPDRRNLNVQLLRTSIPSPEELCGFPDGTSPDGGSAGICLRPILRGHLSVPVIFHGEVQLRFVPEGLALSMGGAVSNCARNGPPGPDGMRTRLCDLKQWVSAAGTLSQDELVDPPDPEPDAPLTVNSLADSSALDAADGRCDTGGTIGEKPECTLRAALEVANADDDGGEITFDIDTAGMPVITLATPLPTLMKDITLDGTSQDGGFVRLSGAQIALDDGTSTVKGMVIGDVTTAVAVLGGTGHVIEGNSLGVAPATDTKFPINFGIVIAAENVEVRSNRFSCIDGCVQVNDSGSGAVVDRNEIGSTRAGVVFGSATTGVLSFGRAEITNNVTRTTIGGVAVVGPKAADTVVMGNFIGVAANGTTEVGNVGFGVRVDAAPRVAVKNNVITAGKFAGVSVSGSDQTEIVDGVILFGTSGDEQEGPVTGGNASVSGNLIGVLDNGSPSVATTPVGVIVWAGAANVTIADNTIAGQSDSGGAGGTGIELLGGSGHSIVSNRLGTDGVEPIRQSIGIDIVSSTEVMIGGDGAGNTIGATGRGVRLDGDLGDVYIVGNGIGPTAVGIDTEPFDGETTADRVEISNNAIEASETGIELDGTVAVGAVTSNKVRGGESAGIRVGSTVAAATVTDNTVLGADRGIQSLAAGAKIAENSVGIDGDGTISGSRLVGISVLAEADVADNVLVSSGQVGISVSDALNGSAAVARLRGNQIRQTEGVPIVTDTGPAAPRIGAVVRLSKPGATDRTALIVRDLPAEEAGTIEVFANANCDDGEAEVVTRIVRAKRLARSFLVIPLIGRGDNDHFTVTYSNSARGTSALSNCVDRSEGSDGDGDGSPDALEELFGTDAIPGAALTLSDQGDLILFVTGSGSFTSVGAVDDPDPDTHSDDFTLPHGAFAFEIDGLPVGGSATVTVLVVDGESIGGDTYFKHAAQQQGDEPSWFEFVLDEATGTGAVSEVVNPTDLGLPPEVGVGFVRSWTLTIQDGGRGDDGFSPDGRIRDPGGPAVRAATFAEVVSLDPARFLETRSGANEQTFDGLFEGIGRVGAGTFVKLQIAGRGVIPAAGIGAVVMNVTTVGPLAPGFVTAYPCGTKPLASSLNYAGGDVVGNEIVAKLDASGAVCLYSEASTNLVVDVTGYVPSSSAYTPVEPRRFLETRSGPDAQTLDSAFEGAGAVDAQNFVKLQIAGRGEIPASGVSAVVMNLTSITPAGPGFVTAYPCGTRPLASSLNYAGGDVVGNEIVAKLDADGAVCLYSEAATHLVADVTGFVPASSAFTPIEPARFLETRVGSAEQTFDDLFEGVGRVTGGTFLKLTVGGRGVVPSDGVGSVVMNMTAVGPAGPGFITAYPCGIKPLASSLNYDGGDVTGNEVIAKLDETGAVCLFSSSSTDLIVDVTGYVPAGSVAVDG